MRRSFKFIAVLVLLVPLISFAAVTVTVNGTSHTIPQTNEKGWGANVTAWIQAISSYSLQPTGGTFTLTADTDFGATYGLKSVYYKSRSSTPAGSGVLRLGNAETIGWRNAANSGNLLLTVDSSDKLTYNGNVLFGSSPLTASRALVTDASSIISASSVTSTELGYVSGVTSSLCGVNQSCTETNKTLTTPTINILDNALSIKDNADATKILQLELSGITTGTTRTMTIPDANFTAVGAATTQTISGKTFSDATLFSTSVKTPYVKTAAGVTALDIDNRVMYDAAGLQVGGWGDSYFSMIRGALYWANDAGSYAILRGPATGSANYTFYLPNAQGAANTFMKNDGSGNLSWVKATLSSDVTGTLPIANGGTNNASLAVTAGGVLYTDGSKAINTGAGTSGYILQANGASAPTWVAQSSSPTAAADIQNCGLAASVASNALTIALKQADGSTDPGASSAACKISFRSSTATSGAYNQRSVTAALSTVISSGSTAGHMSATNHYIFIYALDNAGTAELAWSSKLFDETQVQTTTAEGGAGAADSSTVLYSTTARASMPIRLLGYLQSNQTTAGTYAAVPTRIFIGYVDWGRLKPVASFYHTLGTSIGGSTNSTIEFDTVVTDNWSMSNGASGASWKAYIKVPGKYRVGNALSFTPNATGVRESVLRKNNAVLSALLQYMPNASYGTPHYAADIVDLVIGDYLTIVVYQDSGGALALNSSNRANRLDIEWVAP